MTSSEYKKHHRARFWCWVCPPRGQRQRVLINCMHWTKDHKKTILLFRVRIIYHKNPNKRHFWRWGELADGPEGRVSMHSFHWMKYRMKPVSFKRAHSICCWMHFVDGVRVGRGERARASTGRPRRLMCGSSAALAAWHLQTRALLVAECILKRWNNTIGHSWLKH